MNIEEQKLYFRILVFALSLGFCLQLVINDLAFRQVRANTIMLEKMNRKMIGVELLVKREMTDAYRDIMANRLMVSEVRNDTEVVKTLLGMDGYHLTLVPMIVPGDVKLANLPEGLRK